MDEILDHSVGVGMIHIETIEFAVGGKVDAGLPLEVEHYPRRVEQRLLARQGREPIGNRIRPNGGRENSRRVRRGHDRIITALRRWTIAKVFRRAVWRSYSTGTTR